MRFRIAAILLGAIMLAGLAGCKKKEEATQTPPASTDQQSQSAPTPAPGQQAAAPAGTPGQAPAETAAAPAPTPAAEEPAPPPPPIVIPAGKTITVRVGSTLSSKTAQDGQPFTGTLANGIAVNGKVVIPAGSGVTGIVSEAKSAGRFKGEAILAIKITSVNVKGVPHDVSTDEYVVTQKGKGKRTAVLVGGGAGGGALIGDSPAVARAL